MSDALDVRALVRTHLEAERRTRGLAAIPWAAVAGAVLVGLVLLFGVRQDLSALPTWRIAALIYVTLVGFIVFPGIALGTWFPSRASQIALVSSAVGAGLLGAIDWTAVEAPDAVALINGCTAPIVITAFALALVAGAAGAFARRRTPTLLWLGGALAACGAVFVTLMCPADGLLHVLSAHFLGAALAGALATLLGWALARRFRRAP